MAHKKLKIAIVTGMWGRFDVFEMFAKGIQHMTKNVRGIEFVTIVAGSEGKASRDLVEGYGFQYIEIPNMPLGKKMNSTIKAAKKHKVDYVLCLGSDDVISVELMRLYREIMRKGIDYIGVTDFYFYDLKSKKALYWGGYRESYRSGYTCGAGRVLSKKLLGKWGWKIWEGRDDQLDGAMQEKLNFSEYSQVTLSCKEFDVYGLDIKSDNNMTAFSRWDNAIFVPEQEIKDKFDYIWE